MTDRFNSLTIVLEKDIREDDAHALIQAITMLRGVLSVEGHVADINAHVAQARVRRELMEGLVKVIHPDKVGQ